MKPQSDTSQFEEMVGRLSPEVAERIQPKTAKHLLLADSPQIVPIWYLIVVPFDNAPKVLKFHSEQSMLAAVRKYMGKEVQCFPIFGAMGKLTEGPFPHFVHPDGRLLPLYDSSQGLPINEDYFVGDRVELEIIEGGRANRQQEQSDDDAPAPTASANVDGADDAYDYEEGAGVPEEADPWKGLSIADDGLNDDDDEEVFEHEPN